MKRLNILFVLYILISCSNNRNVKNAFESIVDSTLIEKTQKEIIHPEIRKSIKELLNCGPIKDFPNISIEESCLVLYSWFMPEDNDVTYYSDSTINLTHNICGGNINYYKGAINVDGVNIAIFDYANFIDAYYNSDSLKHIPYDSFKCYPTNIIPTWKFYVQNGNLIYRDR